MASQDELKAQLRELMALPENMVCCDCNDKRPTWASLLVPPPKAAFTEPIGCFCCYHCSGAHRRMGTHICFVRSTNLDEWKEKELVAVREGGNRLINELFEGLLSEEQKVVVKPDKNTDLELRSKFIYDKYQHRNWYDSKKALRRSVFVPPAPIGGAETDGKSGRSSGHAFDDFFASRTAGFGVSQPTSDDSDVESGEIHFDPNEDLAKRAEPMHMSRLDRSSILWSLERKESQRLGLDIGDDNAISENMQSSFGVTDFSPLPDFFAEFQASGYESMPVSSDNKKSLKASRDPRAELMIRMDSKRQVLDSLRQLGTDDDEDNHLLKPRRVSQNARRRRERRPSSELGDAKEKGSRRRGSGDTDTKSVKSSSRRDKKSTDTTDKERGANPKDSSDSETKGKPKRTERRRPLSRTKSAGSDDGTKLQRATRRGSSNGMEAVKESSSSTRPRQRGERRGVSRAKSMEEDAFELKQMRSQTQNVKRGVRRTMSSDDSFHSTDMSMDNSVASHKSKPDLMSPRRPPRLPRAGGDGESQVSRRSRDDDSHMNRSRRSQRNGSGDELDETRSSRRRNRRSPGRENPTRDTGNAISVQRVPTVRDRVEASPARARRSPRVRGRTLDDKVKSDLTELLANTD